MGGIEFVDGVLTVGREPNKLDELAVEFSSMLEELDVDHAFVAGYVAILVGRSRSTEDIDVLVERFDGETAEGLRTLLGERLNHDRLEAWCERLDVTEEHDRLRRA